MAIPFHLKILWFNVSIPCWNSFTYWLVVDLPLWQIWVRQLGWWNSQYMESHEIHVPHHQPALRSFLALFWPFQVSIHWLLYHIKPRPRYSKWINWDIIETSLRYSMNKKGTCSPYSLNEYWELLRHQSWKSRGEGQKQRLGPSWWFHQQICRLNQISQISECLFKQARWTLHRLNHEKLVMIQISGTTAALHRSFHLNIWFIYG